MTATLIAAYLQNPIRIFKRFSLWESGVAMSSPGKPSA
jgi:hypothetical protein